MHRGCNRGHFLCICFANTIPTIIIAIFLESSPTINAASSIILEVYVALGLPRNRYSTSSLPRAVSRNTRFPPRSPFHAQVEIEVKSPSLVSRGNSFHQPKLTGIIDDEVLGFKIPVRDSLCVHVCEGVDDHGTIEVDVVRGQA